MGAGGLSSLLNTSQRINHRASIQISIQMPASSAGKADLLNFSPLTSRTYTYNHQLYLPAILHTTDHCL